MLVGEPVLVQTNAERSEETLTSYAAPVVHRVPSWEIENEKPSTVKSSRSPTSNGGPELVAAAWQTYATGGAKADDRRLAQLEADVHEAHRMHLNQGAMLIEFEDGVVGDGSPGKLRMIPATSGKSANARVSSGGHLKHTQHTQHSASVVTSVSSSSRSEPSLLD